MNDEETKYIGIDELYNGIGKDIKISLPTIFGDVCRELDPNIPEEIHTSMMEHLKNRTPFEKKDLTDDNVDTIENFINKYSGAPDTPEDLVTAFKHGLEANRENSVGPALKYYMQIRRAVNTVFKNRKLPYVLVNG